MRSLVRFALLWVLVLVCGLVLIRQSLVTEERFYPAQHLEAWNVEPGIFTWKSQSYTMNAQVRLTIESRDMCWVEVEVQTDDPKYGGGSWHGHRVSLRHFLL